MTHVSQLDSPIDRLNRALVDILNPEDSRAYSFKAHVANRIRQFNLTNHLEANEVINEAYKRAIASIEANKDVEHWQAWFRTTCLNIIREHSRARKKCTSVDPQSHLITNLQAPEFFSIVETEEEKSRQRTQKQLKILAQALQELAKTDCEIIYWLKLKLIDGLGWKAIREQIVQKSSEDEVPSLVAMRQRAARAKRKLRRLYHRIDEEYAKAGLKR